MSERESNSETKYATVQQVRAAILFLACDSEAVSPLAAQLLKGVAATLDGQAPTRPAENPHIRLAAG